MKPLVKAWRARRIALMLLSLSAFTASAHPDSSDSQSSSTDPVLGERIAKGVALKGRLWLRGTMGKNARGDRSGGLVSVGLADQSRKVHFEVGTLDLEKDGDDLWVLRRSASSQQKFIVSIWKKDAFEDVGRFESAGSDVPFALLLSGGIPTVVSERTVRVMSPDHSWRSVSLKGNFRLGVQAAIAKPRVGGSIYVGMNMGEWGGGLQRVDTTTGEITKVERRDDKGLCSGPLNSDCDPVTGVIADPQKSDCVLATVGLVHLFRSDGRLLRVCGDRVTLVSEEQTEGNSGSKQTEAFYGLVPADSGFWAITWRAVYHFGPDGKQDKQYPIPKLKPFSGIHLSREIPGVIVVRTDVNWAVSTSGYTPLVVPLDNFRP